MKVNWVANLLLIINCVLGVLLFASLSAIYIDPNYMWLPSLAGLAYAQIFFLNLLFFFFWLFFKRDYAVVSLTFIIFGLLEVPNHFQFNLPKSPVKKEIKLLSLNVRNFDLYNWTENKKTRDRILHVIKTRNAQIICLQEFFNTTNPGHDFKTLDTILEFNEYYQSHVEYTATVKETEHWGIATFTSFPIVSSGRISFEENSNNICIYTDILIEQDTFRLYNMHLASVKFGHEDYQYLEKVVDRNIDPTVKESKSLALKLKDAFKKRANQVKAIRSHLDESPYPIILCGDFNDTPTSYAYNKLITGLKDTFREKGNGMGATYNGKLPYLRIDYIFTDPKITILEHEVIHSDISDHFPISASIEIPD